jgi:transcriptional regulator with XRE-family HTH domain
MPKPYNFLKTCRRRAGLTQADAAKLTGSRGPLQFARYERHLVDPPLRIAVACEQLFGVPIAELFGGLNDEVNASTLRRSRSFKERLTRAVIDAPNNRRLLHTLEWITERLLAWLVRKPLEAL